MGEKVDDNAFANSQCAIREYIHFKLENEYMHEARVLVSSMGKPRYNDILKVVPRIETNNLLVLCQDLVQVKMRFSPF